MKDGICRRTNQMLSICRDNPFPVQVMLIFLYRLALDFIYLTQLSPLYAYAGFTTNIDILKYLGSWLAVAIAASFVAALQEDVRVSSALVTFLNFLYFIPLTSYYGCKGASTAFFAWAMVYWAILLALQFRLPSVQLQPMNVCRNKSLFVILTVGAVGFVMLISGLYTGFRLTLEIVNVYGIRAEAAAYQMPTAFQYLLSGMTMILSVVLLYWLRLRKYLTVIIVILVYIFYYSIAAHKSVFLFLILLLGCYVCYRPWMLRWAAGFLSIGVGLCWLANRCFGVPHLMSYLIRRLMYVPVQISEVCEVFFRENPLNLFREGILGKLSFDRVYSIDIPRLVAESMGDTSNANNGLLGDLFINLPPLIGVILMPLILVIYFRLLDLVSKSLTQKITISFAVYFAISFINTMWSTVLLSHGFLLACVLLYIFPREEEQIL